MSFLTRPGGRARTRTDRWRPVLAPAATVLAALLVLTVLVAPNHLNHLTPAAFLRVPLEALVGVVLVLVLPPRARRVAAVVAGLALGLLAVAKALDLGFTAVLARPFDPVTDLPLLRAGFEFLVGSVGRPGAVVAVVAAAVLAVVLVTGATLAVRRLTRLVVAHRTGAGRVVAVLAAGWVAAAVTGAQVVPGVPVAAHEYERLRQIPESLLDHREFAAELAVDAFHGARPGDLLTALRGKDVIVAFVESYGRAAVADPRFGARIGAVLDEGTRRLAAAGFDARSAYLTSPVVGGGSWLAHATLLSGVRVDNEQRYRTLIGSDRLTLNRAFRRAGWRTVAVMPGVVREWPEAEFFGYDRVYAAADLGYRGPRFSFAPMPDQYTLSAFQRFERSRAGRDPVMAEIALVSSHAPWTPIPPLLPWDEIGDGSDFVADGPVASPSDVWRRDPDQVRREYRDSLEYTLTGLISYVETYGDEDLVVVLLGDHQAAPLVTGEGAGRDVPVTVLAGDPAVLERTADWGWHPGLRPGPRAPVWPMDAFRDRFLAAFGPTVP